MMIKAILLLVGFVVFRVLLPRRERRTNITVTPYGSVFDTAVPADVLASAAIVSPKRSS
jgi:hypothetical protein